MAVIFTKIVTGNQVELTLTMADGQKQKLLLEVEEEEDSYGVAITPEGEGGPAVGFRRSKTRR